MPAAHDDAVQQAVELFIDRHGSGEAIDPETFAAGYPEAAQKAITAGCRQFLQFDGMLGKQTWEHDLEPPQGGRQFGDFLILDEIGRGGMGIVYLAVQRSLNRRVALKVMQSGLTLSKRHVERFRREAEAAAKLRHPGIVAVHSFAEVDGTFAIAMDYVAGRNLGDIVDDLRLAVGNGPVDGAIGVAPGSSYAAECAVLVAQVAAALAVAHQEGIAHRDLKPRNLMLDEHRQVRLLDFGLAKSLDAESLSMSGDLTGTAHYMSPEQTLAQRVPVDQRTDIFSLGVILYELLTLTRPFDGKNLQQVVYEICFKEPKPIHKRNPRVPKDLVTICMKTLEKDPQRRYATAAELEADLQRFLRFEPIQARPTGPLLRATRWVQRHRTGSLAALVATLALTALLVVSWWQRAEAVARAGELMQTAARDADRGQFQEAIAHATEAMALQPGDQGIRKDLELYQQKRITAETRASADKAEASRLITRSQQELARNRATAVLLAIEAYDRQPSLEARCAVLDALGAGFRTVTFAAPDDDPGRPEVWMACMAPDGATIATVLTTGWLRLWSPDGRLLHQDHVYQRVMTDIAFAPDPARKLLATAGDERVCFFAADTGKPVGEMPCGAVADRIFFDGRGDRLLVLCYSMDKQSEWSARVYDTSAMTTGAVPTALGSVAFGSRWIEAAALSPDGRLALCCAGGGKAQLWRAADGETVRQLPVGKDRCWQATFASDSQRLAIASDDGSVRVFAVPSGELLATAHHSSAVKSVAFSPDGSALLTASEDSTARLWRLPADGSGAAVETTVFGGHTARVNRARFDAQGRYVVTASGDGRVRVFDAATGAELCRYEVGMTVNDAAFDPDAKAVLFSSRGTARLWDFTDQLGTVTLRHPNFVNAVAAVGDDKVATACDDRLVRVFSARTGACLRQTAEQDKVVTTLAVDQKGERMAIGTWSGTLTVDSVWNCEPLFELTGHGGPILGAAFTPDGTRLVSLSADSVRVWNALDASTVLAKTSGEQPFAAAALSPDGALLATVREGGRSVELWSVPDGTARKAIAGHGAAIRCIAFRPDGKALLTCSDDQTARLWAPHGELLQTLHAGLSIGCCAFRADGKAVLLCGNSVLDPMAQLWDLERDEPLLRFSGHRGLLTGCAFSPDGQWAITSSRDRTACIWPTDPVAVARRLPLRPMSASERKSFDLPPLPGAAGTR